MSPRALSRLFAALALVTLCAGSASATAVINIINNDGVGEGFNDPTVVAQVGGNTGTTLGQQRLNVFNKAAQLWGAILDSSVPIFVRAQFNPQTCTATSATLGSAGPVTVHSDFPNAPFAATWYHPALANKLAGVDEDPANPDINATFNSDVDNATCLGTSNWYYGYDHVEGANIDLLPVLMHELGHGLGFSTTTSSSTGNYISGQPAVWDRFLMSRSTGKHWYQMTSAERIASAINTNNLVWDGPAVTFKAPLVRTSPPELRVNTPAAQPAIAASAASFGSVLTALGVTGDVVLVTDAGGASTTDGCDTPFANAAALAGKIVLIDRGVCTFPVKAANAQAAGAIGVIIANNTTGVLAPGGADTTIHIPVVGITQADGTLLKSWLAGGANVTLHLNSALWSGLDSNHRALMYAPNPVQPGSSVSHFDVTASPNALMEPAINSDLTDDIDLTHELFEDIGWFAHTTGVGDRPRDGVALSSAPNPSRGGMNVSFMLERDAMVDVQAFDVAGRTVARLQHGRMNAGDHAIAWSARLEPGVYRIALTVDGRTTSRPVVIVR